MLRAFTVLLLASVAWGGVVSVDANGRGTLEGSVQADTGPGGYPFVLTWNLLSSAVPGDVAITYDDSELPFVQLLRFNPDGTMLFYAAMLPGDEPVLAHTPAPPSEFYDNRIILNLSTPHNHSLIVYTPSEDQPGYDGLGTTYEVYTYGAIPEPGTILLVAAGLLLAIAVSRNRAVRTAVPVLALTIAAGEARAQYQVTPVLDCMTYDPVINGITAYFGYDNPGTSDENVPFGQFNFFLPSPPFRGQPTIFSPGRVTRAFSVTFPATSFVEWTLGSAKVRVQLSTGKFCSEKMGPLQFAPIGLSATQTMRIKLTGGNCRATISFTGSSGQAVGPTQKSVTETSATETLDIAGTALGLTTGQRAMVTPVVTPTNQSIERFCYPAVEVFATSSGVTAASVSPQREPATTPQLPAMGVSPNQTLRVAVTNKSGFTCNANLSFLNLAGQSVGSTSSVSAASGSIAWLDLPSTQIPGLTGWTGRAEIRPVVAITSGACVASAEVFDTFSGATRANVPAGVAP